MAESHYLDELTICLQSVPKELRPYFEAHSAAIYDLIRSRLEMLGVNEENIGDCRLDVDEDLDQWRGAPIGVWEEGNLLGSITINLRDDGYSVEIQR